jgi:uncharacterized heparinase superfamily protein
MPFHIGGGKGTLPKVVRFHLRPDLRVRRTEHEKKVAQS